MFRQKHRQEFFQFFFALNTSSMFKSSVQSLGVMFWNEHYPKIEIIITKPNWIDYKSKYQIFVDSCKEIIIKERKIVFM